METLTTELVETGEKRDRRGRRIALAQTRAAAIAAYERSGLTQAAFAQREGIKFFTFTNWLRTERARKLRSAAFAEVKLSATQSSSPMEVALPNGLIVRGADVEQLAVLVGRLRQC
jgi:transposase-like protein